MIKLFNEPCGVALSIEASKRMRDSPSSVSVQPSLCFAAPRLFQERLDKYAINVLLRGAVLRGQVRPCGMNSRERFVPPCRLAVFAGADGPALEVKAFGKQRPVAQPDSISPAELAPKRRDFHLELPVVMPGPLDARAAQHSVFAEQAAGLVPLAADAVRHAVLVGLFRCEQPVPVPSAADPVPLAVPQGDFLANQPGSVKVPLDSGFHTVRAGSRQTPSRSDSIKPDDQKIANPLFSPSSDNRRGANSTRPHERDREAPMREARQAAPDWARASAALSSGESSRFSRGTEPLRRKINLCVQFMRMANPIRRREYSPQCVVAATRFAGRRGPAG